MKGLQALFFAFIFFTPLAMARDASSFCEQWEDLPIRQMGRSKPLYVHAQETIKYLTGKSNWKGHSALEVYCLLSLQEKAPENLKLMASIEHVQLKKALEMEGQKQIPYDELLEKKDQLIMLSRQQADSPGPYQKAIDKTLGQMSLYQDIIASTNWMVPLQEQGEIAWYPIRQLRPHGPFAKASTLLRPLLQKARDGYAKAMGNRHLIELFYVKSKIHHISMAIILLALFFLVLAKSPRPGAICAALALFVQIAAIILRIIISQRAPITNMYETVLFSGVGALLMAMIIGHLRQEKVYLISGLCYNFLCNLMLIFAHGMLSPRISPLVPVLRDNFWLSTHVTTVILSYGAFALSWILANMALIRRRFFGLAPKEFRYYSGLIYTCVKVGAILLALGIILGGVWADYSWGRFWGWDPKETWSAIALCLYLAIVHGKYTNWIGDGQFVPAVAMAFMGIMMAWFGVNYILASGLHSYGFSEGGAIFLGSFFMAQTLIFVATVIRPQSKGKKA